MHPYGVHDVEKLLRLTRGTIRAMIEAGFVTPERGPRNAWRFSFQDLIVLRTAQALVAANVPQRRITRSMRELRRHLPDTMPRSGLSIGAVADRVVVREGRTRWQADSGQYLLAFEGDPADGSLSVIERAPAPEASPASVDIDGLIDRGLTLHEAGRLAEAERVYRDAIDACDDDSVLYYNLAILLEDMERAAEAVQAYEAAISRDPAFADAHYNLALLHEARGRPREALRHMSQYRRLAGGRQG
jgi:tetratricopeptide (TPR) repeat protein